MTHRVTDPEMLLWPKLSRFYGLSFGELRRMKRVFVRMYAEQMEVIHAQEMVDALTVSAYPYMKEEDQRATFRQHINSIRAAARESAPEADPRTKPLPNPDALAALGIAVVRKEPVAKEADVA